MTGFLPDKDAVNMDQIGSHIIYMDNAATVRLKDEALAAMMPYLKGSFANPGGVYDPAQEIKKDVAAAREDIAAAIGAYPTEIFFTSGGSESDNQAIRGVAELDPIRVPHIITSSFEHHAVLNTCRYLEKKGLARVSYVNPSPSGFVNAADIERQIEKDTVLISVMMVNNELGTIQPVRELGAVAKEHGILFHTDAVAAVGHLPIDVKEMNIDLMSASGHKFGGPKGAGFLYVRENLKLPPLIYGGSQERGRRAGTENVPGTIGMAAALKAMNDEMDKNLEKRRELDEYFISEIESWCATGTDGAMGTVLLAPVSCAKRTVPVARTAPVASRMPGHFSLTLPGVNAEELIVRLGMKGICISAGAACASSDNEGSHVLKAVGLKGDALKSTVRITMNEDNTEEEIDTFFEELGRLINNGRYGGIT